MVTSPGRCNTAARMSPPIASFRGCTHDARRQSLRTCEPAASWGTTPSGPGAADPQRRKDIHMAEIGYMLSSEEHPASDLVRFARSAEEVGFEYAVISDHYHPWLERSGQSESPFVWTVLGAIAAATEQLRLGTAVTCPILRYHPAIVAQAAATVATMAPERFFLGVGTGENLNEHVVGRQWPPHEVRAEMLEEAVGVIRRLFEGEMVTHHGEHFTVEDAKVYSRPDVPVPIVIAAAGPAAAKLAGRRG